MIMSFQHKGLRVFFETGNTRGIRAEHAARLARILSFLERAAAPNDVDLPGWRAAASVERHVGRILVNCRQWQLARDISLCRKRR